MEKDGIQGVIDGMHLYSLNNGFPTKLIAARIGSGMERALGSKIYLPSSVRQTPS